MLDRGDDTAIAVPHSLSCEKAWDELECGIQIPRKWLSYFQMQGVVATTMEDRRRFARFYYHVRGVLHYRTTLAAFPRSEGRYLVLTRDISREGVCFLHEEQLFLCECMPLQLPSGKLMEIEVCRCNKHNHRCFEIGARFTQPTAEPAEDAHAGR